MHERGRENDKASASNNDLWGKWWSLSPFFLSLLWCCFIGPHYTWLKSTEQAINAVTWNFLFPLPHYTHTHKRMLLHFYSYINRLHSQHTHKKREVDVGFSLISSWSFVYRVHLLSHCHFTCSCDIYILQSLTILESSFSSLFLSQTSQVSPVYFLLTSLLGRFTFVSFFFFFFFLSLLILPHERRKTRDKTPAKSKYRQSHEISIRKTELSFFRAVGARHFEARKKYSKADFQKQVTQPRYPLHLPCLLLCVYLTLSRLSSLSSPWRGESVYPTKCTHLTDWWKSTVKCKNGSLYSW